MGDDGEGGVEGVGGVMVGVGVLWGFCWAVLGFVDL